MRTLGQASSRKLWLGIASLLFLHCAVPLMSAEESPAGNCLVYVGTYSGNGSEGIYTCRFDTATGNAGQVSLAAVTENPSFLAVDARGRFLYAVNELNSFNFQPAGAISVFGIDQGTGGLQRLQQVSSLGAGPTHLSLDRSGRFLLVANDIGGNVAVFPIGTDGLLGPHTALDQHPAESSVNSKRQGGPHAQYIQVTYNNEFALCADLGLDKLFMYHFDGNTGSLRPCNPAFKKMDPGSGPRHAAISSSGKMVYVLNELTSTVTAFAYDPGPAKLRKKQTISTLPKDFVANNSASEIQLDSRGRFLYVSNRGDDSIVVFKINRENGLLMFVERVPSGGVTPRHIAIDPGGSWLFAANQDSNTITIFKIDPATGKLTPRNEPLSVLSPVCVVFVPLKNTAPGGSR